MAALITILREVRDPRDLNARHDLADMLFVALAATLCGAKSCVEIAEFAAASEGSARRSSTCRMARRATTPSAGSSGCSIRRNWPVAFAPSCGALRDGWGFGRRRAWWRSTARACAAATRGGAPSCRR